MTTPAQEPSREQRLAEIRGQLHPAGYSPADDYGRDVDNSEVRFLLAEVERLEAALRGYGRHRSHCERELFDPPRSGWRCVCGFDALNGESA